LFDFLEEEIIEAKSGLSDYFHRIRSSKEWTGLKLQIVACPQISPCCREGAALIMPQNEI